MQKLNQFGYRVKSMLKRKSRSLVKPGQSLVIGPAERTSLIICPSPNVVIGPSTREEKPIIKTIPPILVNPVDPLVIKPQSRPYWEERGWIRRQTNGREEYVGFYQVSEKKTDRQYSFPGRIVALGNEFVPYLGHPPPQLKLHKKWICFRKKEGLDWYGLEWFQPAQHPDETILYVQQILDESINKI